MDEKGELRAIITMMLNSLTSIDIKGKTLRYNHPAVGDPCLDASDHELHLLSTHKSQDSETFKKWACYWLCNSISTARCNHSMTIQAREIHGFSAREDWESACAEYELKFSVSTLDGVTTIFLCSRHDKRYPTYTRAFRTLIGISRYRESRVHCRYIYQMTSVQTSEFHSTYITLTGYIG